MDIRRQFPFILVLTLMLSACTLVRGSGKVITETREVSDFESVELNGIGELVITQGEQESLTIEAESNIVRRIETEVRGGMLIIEFTRGFWGDIVPTEPIKFEITMIEVASLNLSGAGRIYADSIDTDRLDIDISGVGDIIIDSLTADTLDLNLSGAGTIDLAGKVKVQQINLSSVGTYSAAGLESETARINLSGAGTASVWATKNLDVEISGLGNVEYYGNPSVTQDISGLGRLENLGDP